MGLKPLNINRKVGNCRYHSEIENTQFFKTSKDEKKGLKKKREVKRVNKLFDTKREDKVWEIFEAESMKTCDLLNIRYDKNGDSHFISTRDPEI